MASVATQRFLRVAACAAALLLFTQALGASVDAPARIRTLPRHTFVSNVTFVVFDTETTGFSPARDRIVEIGAVRFRNGKVLDEKKWLVNPGRHIPPWASRVHGITDETVRDRPDFKDVYAEFLDFIGDSVLIAHNARFDIGFLSQEAKRAGYDLPKNHVIDSLGLFRRWFPESKNHTLKTLVSHTGVSIDQFHRALADSRYVFLIFDKGLADHDPEIRLGDLYLASGGPLRF